MRGVYEMEHFSPESFDRAEADLNMRSIAIRNMLRRTNV